MRLLGLVPARGGSTRLPGKNLKRLRGRTLVRRALETAQACGRLDPVVLSSDASEILAEGDALRGVRCLRRPGELATATAHAHGVVVHALEVLEAERGERFDAVCIVQTTAPLILPEDVAGTVDLFVRSGARSAASVVKVPHDVNPLKMKRLQGDRLVPFLEDDGLRLAHELPELWVRNAAIYVTHRDLVDDGALLSDDCRGYVMPPERSVDINDPIDLAFAQFLLERGGATVHQP